MAAAIGGEVAKSIDGKAVRRDLVRKLERLGIPTSDVTLFVAGRETVRRPGTAVAFTAADAFSS